MGNSSEFTRKYLLNYVASLKTRFQRRFFPVNFAKLVRSPFLQNTTGRLVLIITVPTTVMAKLGNEIVNQDTKTKAYAPI